MKFISALVTGVLAVGTQAHMSLDYPAEFHGMTNPHTKTKIDAVKNPLQVSPLVIDKFLCKGYQVEMKDPIGEGAPTAIWKQGGDYNFTIGGGAPHDGGSCQIGLSYDLGKTFTVIHSYLGNCSYKGQHLFTMPSDAPVSKGAIFAWTWYGKLGGTREIYMNCASVAIEAGTGKAPAVAFNKRPDMAFFNMYNPAGFCQTDDSTEAIFPDPGPAADVTTNLSTPDKSKKVTAECVESNRKYLALGKTSDMVFVGGGAIGSVSGAGTYNSGYINNIGSSATVVLSSSTAAPSPLKTADYLVTGSLSSSLALVMPTAQSSVVSSATSAATKSASGIASSLPQVVSPVLTYPSPTKNTVTIYTTSTMTAESFGQASSSAEDACGEDPTATVTVTASEIVASAYPSAPANIPAPDPVPTPYTSSTSPDTSSPSDTPSPATSAITSSTTQAAGGITTDGTCGPTGNGATCKDSTIYGACCSPFGYCGILAAHCGTGCLEAFGVCGDAGKTAHPGVSKRGVRQKAWIA